MRARNAEETARLTASERMEAAELRYLQEGLLRELLLFCFEYVEAYRPYWRLRNEAKTDPAGILLRLPPLTRAAFKRNPPAYMGEAGKALPRTGTPVGGLYQDTPLWSRFLGWYHLVPGDRHAALVGLPPGISGARRGALWWLNRARGVFVLDAYGFYPEALPLKALAAFKPAYVYGLGGAYELVAGKLGLDVPVFLTGEAAEGQTQVYETAEYGPVAMACPEAGRLHINAERFWVEILSETGEPLPPGETGFVAVTDLRDMTLPRLRFLTGDKAALMPEGCLCGRGLPVLTGLQGRREAVLSCPDGKRVHGRALDELARPYRGVARFQLIQDGPAHGILTVQRRGGASFDDARAFHREVERWLDGVHIEFRQADSLPQGAPRFSHTVNQT